jgi:hypothetical protein
LSRGKAVLLTGIIAGGLALDQHVRVWGQLLVNVAVWLFLLYFVWRAAPRERFMLLACLGYAALGEIVLSPLWGLYAYREAGVPLFVPPGHALLFMLGTNLAARGEDWLVRVVPLAAAPFVLLMAATGADTAGLVLFGIFLACLRFGPSPRLYAVMFVLSLAMEIYGVWVGNWAWAAQVPGLGLTLNNPPLAAGAFYCVLDLLVLGTRNLLYRPQSQAAPRTPLESPWTWRARRVATWSEKTYRVQRRGTSA